MEIEYEVLLLLLYNVLLITVNNCDEVLPGCGYYL